MNRLIEQANEMLKRGGFEYAVCGGFAIELFLSKEIRKHGDIDICAFWNERDSIILYMESLGFKVFEMCGNGIAHHITDLNKQFKSKRNIFCVGKGCDIVSLTAQDEKDMYFLEFDHSGQKELNFIEFLFNDKTEKDFLYARNKDVSLALSKAILYREEIAFLAPEMVLLYKSTDILREGYQTDFQMAMAEMSAAQKEWLKNALIMMNPSGHRWIESWEQS